MTVAPPAAIVDALLAGTLDAELAGLLWLLAEGGVPIVVAGPGATPVDRARRAAVLAAVLDLVPADRRRVSLAGPAEDFAWLADAEALGWRRTLPAADVPLDPARTVLLAGELGVGPPADTIADLARLVIRALGRGFGFGATIEASRLEEVFDRLRARPVGLTDDELSRLGVVVVLGPVEGDEPPRIAAAHYVRPLARDVHGHPQRLPPAVLATWDGGAARFEHFAWGAAAELAERIGRRTGDFEAEREHRAAALGGLPAVRPAG